MYIDYPVSKVIEGKRCLFYVKTRLMISLSNKTDTNKGYVLVWENSKIQRMPGYVFISLYL